MEGRPLVDVVVVSYNSRAELRRCVEGLSRDSAVHVIVADNASPDGSLEAIADLPVTAVALAENRGFAAGCNAGWRAGTAEFVLFLNPDAVIDGASVRALAEVVRRDSRIGAAGPRIQDEDGTLDLSLRRFPRPLSTLAQAFFLHRVFPRASWTDEVVHDPARYEAGGAVDWISGACMLVRRSVLEELDGLDEGFFMYSEDKDLCRRIWDAGYEVVYEPSALAVHEGGGGKSAPRSSLLPVMAASRIRYARKHQAPLTALLERAAVGTLALTHVVVSRGGRARRAGHAAALLVAAGLRGPGYPAKSS